MERSAATKIGEPAALHRPVRPETKASCRQLGHTLLLNPRYHTVKHDVAHRGFPRELPLLAPEATTAEATQHAEEAATRRAVLRRIAHQRVLAEEINRDRTIPLRGQHVAELLVPARMDAKDVMEDDDCSLALTLGWPRDIALDAFDVDHISLWLVIRHFAEWLRPLRTAIRQVVVVGRRHARVPVLCLQGGQARSPFRCYCRKA
mmetsp:Transcript_10778/g.18949  ORF Transcript_10778/g.18949 Transcript_10778/m.18949 type:complete len:205 (-) Transcript_10778:2-616(-)